MKMKPIFLINSGEMYNVGGPLFLDHPTCNGIPLLHKATRLGRKINKNKKQSPLRTRLTFTHSHFHQIPSHFLASQS